MTAHSGVEMPAWHHAGSQTSLDSCPTAQMSQAGVRYASRDPLSYVRSNVAGFVTLLEAVKAAGGSGGNGGSSGNDSGSRGARQPPAPPVIYASSSSVYGLNEEQPFRQEKRRVCTRPAWDQHVLLALPVLMCTRWTDSCNPPFCTARAMRWTNRPACMQRRNG